MGYCFVPIHRYSSTHEYLVSSPLLQMAVLWAGRAVSLVVGKGVGYLGTPLVLEYSSTSEFCNPIVEGAQTFSFLEMDPFFRIPAQMLCHPTSPVLFLVVCSLYYARCPARLEGRNNAKAAS